MKIQIYLSLLLALSTCLVFGQNSSMTYLFVGSYTSGEKAEGICVYEFNTENGELTEVAKGHNLINPSFLAISPNGKYLYACTETKMSKYGSLSAFKIDSLTGKITFLNKQTTGGRNPVYASVDKTGRYVITANYTDARINIFECNLDGSLRPFSQLFKFQGNSIIEGRQDEAHVHSSIFSPDNKYVFAPDLGADKIHVFNFDHENLLTINNSLTIDADKGAGPRHFTFHPTEPFAYCVQELSGTISFYKYKNGQLSLSNTYRNYAQNQDEYASADIHISPDGKYLYASNRQDENSISIFGINTDNGELSLVNHQTTYGAIPRSFVIDPSGKFLIVANQNTNNIVVFRRNTENGLLKKIGSTTGITSPSSLKMIKYGG